LESGGGRSLVIHKPILIHIYSPKSRFTQSPGKHFDHKNFVDTYLWLAFQYCTWHYMKILYQVLLHSN
jgi:hypothetical protein